VGHSEVLMNPDNWSTQYPFDLSFGKVCSFDEVLRLCRKMRVNYPNFCAQTSYYKKYIKMH